MAGQEGLEPPTAGFGVRSPANWATGLLYPLSYKGIGGIIPGYNKGEYKLFYLFVQGVFVAPWTVLSEL